MTEQFGLAAKAMVKWFSWCQDEVKISGSSCTDGGVRLMMDYVKVGSSVPLATPVPPVHSPPPTW